ncbi:MAG: hypothetical protein QNL91_16265 [Candidatus Krumholzibacteria bacterium]|nr:hypothetical protein [Candidatus Krumholzibacteria bacterium]
MRTALTMPRLVFLLPLVLLLISPSLSSAAGFAKVGTVGFSWEGLFNGARQTSMGSSDMAGAQGPAALFLNTAPLQLATAVEAEYGRAKFVSSADLEMLGVSVVWKGFRAGFSRQQLLMDPQLVRTAYEPDGTGETFESTAGISVAGISYDLGPLIDPAGHWSWTVGAAKRWYYGSVATSEMSEGTYDLGTSLGWRTDFSRGAFLLKGGASWMNTSGQGYLFVERDTPIALPQSRRAGITAETILNADGTGKEALRLVVAYAKTTHEESYLADQDHFGVELVAMGVVAVRGGRNSRFDNSHSWGLGAILHRPFMGPVRVKLDYGKYDNGWGKREMWSAGGEFSF